MTTGGRNSRFDFSDEGLAAFRELLAEQGLATEGDGRIPRRRTDAPAPLSYAQQRLWFLHHWEPTSDRYNMSSALRLEGRLTADAVHRAFGTIIERHEILRTAFPAREGRPRQVVRPSVPTPFGVADLTALPETARLREARLLGVRQARRPFDLTEAPLLRVVLARLGRDDHALLTTCHHAVADGWSMGVLVREVVAAFEAFSRGERPSLPDLDLQYADYAAWQRDRVESEEGRAETRHWIDLIRDHPRILDLATDRSRPATPSGRGGRVDRSLPRELSRRVRERGQEWRATPFMVLLAGFEAILARRAGQERFLVGTPIANRDRAELEPMIGCFVNTLVLPADLTGAPSFRELMERTRSVALDAQDHQGVPFEQLLEELEPERDLSHSPLFQALFVYQNAAQGLRRGGGIEVRDLGVPTTAAKFDLLLSADEIDGRFLLSLEYAADLFDPTTARRLLAHLERLLEGAVERPEAPWTALGSLPPGERQQALVEWNDTAQAGWGRAVLHGAIARRAAEHPDRVVVSFGEQHLSYGALMARAGRLAAHLRSVGVGRGDVVGVLLERRADLLTHLVAILWAGAAYVPLDPEYPAERLRGMVADAAARAVIGDADGLVRLDPSPDVVRLDADALATDLRELEPAAAVPAGADDTAYVLFTSGSTGRPKGVEVHHGGIVNRLEWMQAVYGLTDDDTVIQKTPLSFDVSVWELFWPLRAGARLHVARPGGHRDAEYLAAEVATRRVTVMHSVPSMLRLFVAAEGAGGCRSLRQVVASGEALPPELAASLHERIGVPLDNLYGPTEASVDVSRWRYRPGAPEIPIGRPIGNLALYVLDAGLRPAPQGVAGELCIGGVGVARGYRGRPSLTAERFVPDPWSEGGRLYRTGDLARHRADGCLLYLGRLDHQVKVRGFRIELGEVEAALGAHPGVAQCAVVTRPGPAGEGGERLVGYWVPRDGEAPGVETLREHLGATLPDHMVPALFVRMDTLPLSTSGKVDRKALPEPDDRRPDLERPFVPPTGVEERLLATVWSRVLSVSRVGAEDNFFTLGGDSISSVQAVALAQERGLSFEVQDLFRHQTVRQLARAVRKAASTGEAAAPEAVETAPFELVSPEDRERLPDGLEDAYPLTQLQAGMLFHLELAPDEGLYHNVVSFRLAAPYDAAAFDRAVEHVVSRHAAMRTSFDLHRYGEPLQLVHREARLPVAHLDLRNLPPERRDAAVAELMERERRHLFDISRPPLMRVHVQRLDEEEFQLTLTESHTVSDGWSLHSTLDDLSRAYFAILRGEDPAEGDEGSTSLRSFVRLEREILESPEAERFWERVLDTQTFTLLPPREGAVDAEVAAGDRRLVGSVDVELPADLSGRLLELSRSLALPVKSILLAVHLHVLGRLAGQRDVTTGFITHGRPETPDGHRLRGLFLNTLPLRVELPGGAWRELAEAAFVAERDLMPYRRYPLAALQRRVGQRPLFEVAFNFVHFRVVEGLLRSGRLAVRGFEKYEPTNFPLLVGFALGAGNDRLELELAYDVRRFGAAQARRIGHLYADALAAFADDPSSPRRERPARPAERQRTLREWNDTTALPPDAATIHERFERQVAGTPDRTALVTGDGRLSYAGLDRQAERIAAALRAAGARRGGRVAIALDRVERGADLVAGLLGILKTGAAYVPIDPAYPRQRVEQILTDCGAGVTLTGGRIAETLPETGSRIVRVDDALPDPAPVPSGAGSRDLAYVIYTSGSTGRPKGVAIEHRSTLGRLRWAERTFGADGLDGVLAATSVCFDLSVFEIFGPLTCGGKVVLAANALELPLLAASSEVRLVNTVPSALQELVRSAELPSGVTTVNLAGEALPRELVETLYGLPGVERVANLYGPSEDTTYSTGARLDPGAPGAPPIGRPLDGSRAYVLDDRMAPAPAGSLGELHLGGAGLARGYLGRPGLTAERFVPSPFGEEAGSRLYRTGDLARHRPDGQLEFLGRRDHQVKVRGFRIELGEVEEALRSHPLVREAVAVARSIGGLRDLVAFLSVDGPSELSAGTLRSFLAGLLPEAMIPARFVVLDALPRTPNGKVDRRALAVEEGDVLASGVPFEAPEGELEEAIADVWREVLGVEEIGVHDNFFEIGGSSLLLLRVHRKIRHAVGRELPMTHLFRFPTVAALAGHLAGTDGEADAAEEGESRAAARQESLDHRRRLRERRRSVGV